MFAAPLFAFRFEAQVWLPACGVLVAFCLISSAVYLLDPLAGEVLLYRLIQVGYSLQLKRMPLLDLGLPRFSGQVSGLHGCECTGVDALLLVVDRAEVANR